MSDEQPDNGQTPDEALSSSGPSADSGHGAEGHGGDDAVRQAAQELLRAARSFLDAAERTLSDDETMQRWADRGQDMVRGFLAGLTSDPGAGQRPDDDDGIEHIPVD